MWVCLTQLSSQTLLFQTKHCKISKGQTPFISQQSPALIVGEKMISVSNKKLRWHNLIMIQDYLKAAWEYWPKYWCKVKCFVFCYSFDYLKIVFWNTDAGDRKGWCFWAGFITCSRPWLCTPVLKCHLFLITWLTKTLVKAMAEAQSSVGCWTEAVSKSMASFLLRLCGLPDPVCLCTGIWNPVWWVWSRVGDCEHCTYWTRWTPFPLVHLSLAHFCMVVNTLSL